MYLDVTESSRTDPIPPARFGSPDVEGNKLDFDPRFFGAGSAVHHGDVTDVKLQFTMMTLPMTGVTSLMITESGYYSLLGWGTSATKVYADLTVDMKILEVDGETLDNPFWIHDATSLMRNLEDDGPIHGAPWENGLLLELGPALLDIKPDFQHGVTKAKVKIHDRLRAKSEHFSLSGIIKTDFMIMPGVEIDPRLLPEPSGFMLALIGASLVLRSRQFK